VVQDPKDAAFAEMPMTALNRAKPDHVVPLGDMSALLASLARKPAGETKALPRSVLAETWAGKMSEFERETEIIRNSTRRMDRLAAQACRQVEHGGVTRRLPNGRLRRALQSVLRRPARLGSA
jgi:hypothetical protein